MLIHISSTKAIRLKFLFILWVLTFGGVGDLDECPKILLPYDSLRVLSSTSEYVWYECLLPRDGEPLPSSKMIRG